MRPSAVTAVASIVSSAAPDKARWPRWMTCQSVMQPSMAEYWHIGAMMMRLASERRSTWNGVRSLGTAMILSKAEEAASDELEIHHLEPRLEISAAEGVEIGIGRRRQAAIRQLYFARPTIEGKRLERDLARTKRLQRQPHRVLLLAIVTERHRLDVIVVRVLAAEIEAEQIPYLE